MVEPLTSNKFLLKLSTLHNFSENKMEREKTERMIQVAYRSSEGFDRPSICGLCRLDAAAESEFRISEQGLT